MSVLPRFVSAIILAGLKHLDADTCWAPRTMRTRTISSRQNSSLRPLTIVTKSRTLSAVLISLLIAAVCSCENGVFLLIFNNTGSDISVRRYDTVGHYDSHLILSGTNRSAPKRLLPEEGLTDSGE